jgi:HIV-1 Vpr-binding protein
MFEEETAHYMQRDPDPFDERHPSRTDPTSELGKNLKLLFKKETFMNRQVLSPHTIRREQYFK